LYHHSGGIDRSETIHLIYTCKDGFGRPASSGEGKRAKYLYISSMETESAVKFYRSCGSTITSEIDEELFEKEPHDIHMRLTL
jgi:hypothetical protein